MTRRYQMLCMPRLYAIPKRTVVRPDISIPKARKNRRSTRSATNPLDEYIINQW